MVANDNSILYRQEFLTLDFFYSKYVEFYRSSHKSIMSRLSSESQREFYDRNHSILTKSQFERHVQLMDFSARDEYLTNILMGFAEAVEESRHELMQMMRNAAAKTRSGDCRNEVM